MKIKIKFTELINIATFYIQLIIHSICLIGINNKLK